MTNEASVCCRWRPRGSPCRLIILTRLRRRRLFSLIPIFLFLAFAGGRLSVDYICTRPTNGIITSTQVSAYRIFLGGEPQLLPVAASNKCVLRHERHGEGTSLSKPNCVLVPMPITPIHPLIVFCRFRWCRSERIVYSIPFQQAFETCSYPK